TTTGSFIARSDDPAKSLKDIVGRKVFIGLPEPDEKYAEAVASLRLSGANVEKRASHSEAALDVLDSQLSPPPMAVIPSWALPLLEGCGSVKPGSLRVLGKMRPTPFIATFLSDSIPAETEEKILKALLDLNKDTKL